MRASFADMKASFSDRMARTSACGTSSAESSPRRGSGWQLPTVDMGSLRSAANDLYTKAEKSLASARGEEPPRSAASKAGATSSGTRRSLTPEQRVARFERTLRTSPVPLAQLCNLAFVEGVPDGGAISSNLRAITWKLLLRYLPPEHANWQPHLERQRAQYAAFLGELTVDPRTVEPASHATAEGGAPALAAADAESAALTLALSLTLTLTLTLTLPLTRRPRRPTSRTRSRCATSGSTRWRSTTPTRSAASTSPSARLGLGQG